jgi:hypothetical protein
VFHNHLVVDLLTELFPFGSDPFVRLREPGEAAQDLDGLSSAHAALLSVGNPGFSTIGLSTAPAGVDSPG